jgi:hypothetical protein
MRLARLAPVRLRVAGQPISPLVNQVSTSSSPYSIWFKVKHPLVIPARLHMFCELKYAYEHYPILSFYAKSKKSFNVRSWHSGIKG